jgi:dienelactone hydrolase
VKTWTGWPAAQSSGDLLVRDSRQAGDRDKEPSPLAGRAGRGGIRSASASRSDSISHWPDEPYKIVWQVRANGTHRIFPFYNPDWVRRSISAMKMGTASGYTIEGEDAYYPKSPDYYLADPKSKYCDWMHQRDEMYWMTWGRLGYDPKTPDAAFDARARELLGKGSDGLVQAWKHASVLVPYATMAYSLGPDHRDYAPEFEWGGDTGAYVHGGGFDTSFFEPIDEYFANKATGGIDGRVRPKDSAERLVGWSSMDAPAGATKRATEIQQMVLLMEARAAYVGYRLYSAFGSCMPRDERSSEVMISPVNALDDAVSMNKSLATNDWTRPFTERLRMHTNTFSWASEQKLVEAEILRLNPEWKPPSAMDTPAIAPPAEPRIVRENALTWSSSGGFVHCSLRTPGDRAWLLYKPLPSSTVFHRIEMRASKEGFDISFPRKPWGYAIAAELKYGPYIVRVPKVSETAPYLIVPAEPKPTPQIYNSSEALTYLDPSVIKPEKYGAILIGTRADNFFHRFNRSTMRKLLEPVSKGMPLIILQEDFSKDKLDFLPQPIAFRNEVANHFDGSGQFGMPNVDAPGVMWQRLLPTRGWEVFGSGALARYPYGKGAIWVTSARLMQNMEIPSAAQAFVKLLSIGGYNKPTIVVDAGSERPGTSCHEDLMNSHGIPFLTLGEVIAEEQGMNSFTPIPGPILHDDVLEGRGPQMAAKFVRDRVIALSKRPTPPDLATFETVRSARRKELFRSLGLDPMPAKTPLNARITGTLQRDGYKIEKFALESRPRFWVTGHIYVPDGPHGRLPVVMNVNGHWAHKKDEFPIQLRAAFQAKQGYLAVAIDSPGYSFEGNSLIERRSEGSHEDFDLVEGGTNATGYYVWDAIRTLDYIATRPDADMEHVGITGASGGGLATLYTVAADDRYKAAVPVVYMASLELAPDNGCQCNHVPGTCQIGDRSDVISIAAPKPVLLIGAQEDGEFPPAATRLTHKKMQGTWGLFGKSEDVYVRIFPGGHDYSQSMRESMIGFFNRYLKGQGDGSPVPQPPLTPIDPQDRSLLALDPAPGNERTMREISMEYLANAQSDVPADQAIAINGGRPEASNLNYKEISEGSVRAVTFESEPGLITPGILRLPSGTVKGVVIRMADQGKTAVEDEPAPDGYAVLAIDGLGTGELSGVDMRFPIYAGRSVAFTAGWQFVRAAEAMRRYSANIEIEGDGPMSSQAAMYAGLLDTGFAKVTGTHGLAKWEDVFKPGVDPIAIQPRAHLCGSLDSLRKQVRNGVWETR